MSVGFNRSQVALAVIAALSGGMMMAAPTTVSAAKTPGKYVAGDVHNHTTCSDGAISMQKLVKKATDKTDTPWGLDWFVQAGHGGNGNRNCTLVEDASLTTPAYPYVAGKGPTTSWENSGVTVKGDVSGTSPNRNMWRWQSIQEFQYPLIEYLNEYYDKPLFIGVETNNPGHEHTSMSVIDGQIPGSAELPNGNADALAKWEYCFDRSDTDLSRGVTNMWDCSFTGGINSSSPDWKANGLKLVPASGAGTGTRGAAKALDSVKYLGLLNANTSYFMPTHLERAGPFNPDGNNGFNIENLRNFNNAAPSVAFGFETQPGHGASANRGEYQVKRNNFGGSVGLVDSVGGTTYGGTGVYGAQIGGVWDALLGEGRAFWFFASSDWHNRGSLFGPDDRRTTQDFYPGEYQRSYTMVRNGSDKLKPQTIVDGMRSGNVFASSGQLIDRLAFVACVSYSGITARTNASVENIALTAARNNTDSDVSGCATMGEKIKGVRAGGEIVVAVVVRDPAGSNYSPYTFPNPSLKQVNITQPLNEPVLDHVDLIRGLVTSGIKTASDPDFAGEWPRNTNWLKADGTTAGLGVVPAAAKNTTAAILRTWSTNGWTKVSTPEGEFLKMSFRFPVTDSQYIRLRGTNLPPSVPYETDSAGNPLADVYTNANDLTMLAIPCTTIGTTEFNGCPTHLPVAAANVNGFSNPIVGQKAVAFDVAAWSDLWFYSNPIYVEVLNSKLVAGVQ